MHHLAKVEFSEIPFRLNTQSGALGMTEGCARRLMSICMDHVFHCEGVKDRSPIESVRGSTLVELLEARQIVSALNSAQAAKPGTHTIQMLPTERQLAAIFVANQYDGEEGPEYYPVARANGNAVVVVRMKDEQKQNQSK